MEVRELGYNNIRGCQGGLYVVKTGNITYSGISKFITNLNFIVVKAKR
jgi:hypothetical protein